MKNKNYCLLNECDQYDAHQVRERYEAGYT